jgi:cytochrome c oxidase subunit 3
LGIGFAVFQFFLWANLREQGLFVSSGIYGSFIYSLTWIHAGHIALALFFMFLLVPAVMRGDFSFNNRLRFKNAILFWHFLTLVWALLFLFLFIF